MQVRTFSRKFDQLSDNLKGAVFILIAGLFFTVMMLLVKLLGARLSVFQILLVRQLIMLTIIAPVIARGFPGALKTRTPGLQVLRIVFALLAMLLGFTAVIHIPLADATAIGFAKAFFVTIFAMVILSEPVGIRRWGAVAAGFVGVIIMLRPGTEGVSVHGLMALAGAACAGMVMVLIRLMSRTESTAAILSWQASGVGLLMIVPAFVTWQWPTAQEWLLLGVLGVVSYLGQLFNIFGYARGEASVMASLDYVRLVQAAGLGLLIFGQVPDLSTWLGALVIIGASLYTIQRERRKKQVLVRTPEGRGFS
ncbi:MAG: DMT family transporter [Pseudomonadota bacterium]|nr:DMT family transporter [Pseudomonadota bacterium]